MNETVDTRTLCRATRLSYRQIDYWQTNGLLIPVAGSERHSKDRRWSVDYIPRLLLVYDFQNDMTSRGSKLSLNFIRELIDNFNDGGFRIGRSLIIGWNCDDYREAAKNLVRLYA